MEDRRREWKDKKHLTDKRSLRWQFYFPSCFGPRRWVHTTLSQQIQGWEFAISLIVLLKRATGAIRSFKRANRSFAFQLSKNKDLPKKPMSEFPTMQKNLNLSIKMRLSRLYSECSGIWLILYTVVQVLYCTYIWPRHQTCTVACLLQQRQACYFCSKDSG